MESIYFPTREYFPVFEVPVNSSTTPFSTHPEKEVILAIPNGKKSYLWISNNGEDVCYSVPRNFKTQPQWTEVSTNVSTQYPEPFYGTLLSGTLVYPPTQTTTPQTQSMEYFVADDIFYYAGISLTKSAFCERLEYLLTFFHQYLSTSPITPSVSNQNKQLQIVLVNMRGRNDPPNKPMYRVHHWQLRNVSLVSPYYALSNEPIAPVSLPIPIEQSMTITNRMVKKENKIQPEKSSPKNQWVFQYHLPAYKQKAVFRIIPEEQCDVYSIYARSTNSTINNDEQQWISCGYAGIFDYNTSKILNYHCRNITSHHLDQLEESDDEDEDSHTSESKNNLIAQYFECTFSAKFRKWVPLYFLPQCSTEKVITMDALAVYGENRPRFQAKPQYHSQPLHTKKQSSFYKK
jgi:hypothetical protein